MKRYWLFGLVMVLCLSFLAAPGALAQEARPAKGILPV